MAVELEQVSFDHDGATQPMLFNGRIGPGSLTAIIGPSGAGKTTLLQLIAGFERPDSGVIRLGRLDCTQKPPWKRPVFTIFQEYNLFAHLDVMTNVALGISARRRDWDRQRVDKVLTWVGLEGYGSRRPAQLSGGERQRVALARSLICERPILLLDEPFVSLDPASRQDMLRLLYSLHQELGMTVVLVTHKPEEAMQVATHTGFISNGRIAMLCASDVLFASQDEQLSAYLGTHRFS